MFHLRNKRKFFQRISEINRLTTIYYSEECEGVRRCNPSTLNPQNLPPLPIPKLENTLEKFLKSCEPFVTYTVLKEAKKLCDSFQRNEGEYLQKYLICKAKNSHNWLDDWYTQCTYLCNRDSLPMSTSPILTFPPNTFRNASDQKEYIAKLILAILRFRKLCDCNELPLETWHGYPLDMGIYKKLFSNIRLPKPQCDQLFHFPNSQHIIVIFRNKFFKIKVMGTCNEHLSYEQLIERIHEVMLQDKTTGTPFGLLTSLQRDTWAGVYEHMKSIQTNSEFLEDIEKSIFVVNIDDETPSPVHCEEDKKLNSCQNGFHGYGPEVNGANRWYGKTLQFFITRDGYSGIIFEHSPVEAIPLGKMTDFIIDYINGNEWKNYPDIIMKEPPVRLKFVATKYITTAINDAAEYLEDKIDNFRISILHYDRYGQNFIKESNLSPDAIIQATLQHANIKIHNKIVPQHETATTRRFFLGRSDTIRSCTNEVLIFLKNISKANIPPEKKYSLLAHAVKKHKEITQEVMMGKGIDRHLFGLTMASKELKMPTPKLLQCAAYKKSGTFRIVSRQNPTKRSSFTCYAPGVHGGYGSCYNPRAEDINICVTCRKCDSDCDPGEFLDAWEASMKEISELLMWHKQQELKLKT